MSISSHIIRRFTRRAPDFIVGGVENPYLLRWWLIPRNRFFNVYLHHFLRSDDDRALHDHPYSNLSILLRGCYIEHTESSKGLPRSEIFEAGDWRFRALGSMSHRIELFKGRAAWTLFITGPRYREWGFHCPRGWIHWREFTAPSDKGAVGKGCEP